MFQLKEGSYESTVDAPRWNGKLQKLYGQERGGS